MDKEKRKIIITKMAIISMFLFKYCLSLISSQRADCLDVNKKEIPELKYEERIVNEAFQAIKKERKTIKKKR
jgi:hypothetical protein